MDKRKILVITDYFDSAVESGSELFCTALILQLRSHYDLTVFSKKRNQAPADKSDVSWIAIGDSAAQRPEVLKHFIQTHLEIKSFDLVYNLGGLSFGTHVLAHLDLSKHSIPLVNHFQIMLGHYAWQEGYDQNQQNAYWETQKQVACDATLNIFLSTSEYQLALQGGFDVEEGLVSIIPNGIDPIEFRDVQPDLQLLDNPILSEPEGSVERPHLTRSQPKRSMERPHLILSEPEGSVERPHLIFVAGRLADYSKGVDLLYRAFNELYQERQDVFLVAVGESGRFAALLDDLPSTAFQLMNWLPRNQLLPLMAAADIVVVPSRYEPFGIVTLEAMMLGIPVVGNFVGGLQEAIVHESTGLLNEMEGGSWGLYQAMSDLLKNPQTSQQLGKAGQLRAIHEFNLGRVATLVDRDLKRALRHHHSLIHRSARQW